MKTNKIKKYLPNILAVTIAAASSSVLSFELEEVVVTAQKRAQSLQDVPVTVNALDGEALDKYGVDDLFEVANLVPGMVFFARAR